MSSALTVIQPNTQIVKGGMGLDFSSKLFNLKPATININQPNTQAEGAIRGKLRIVETGDQFDEMYVTLLNMPVERRSFYTGEAGQLNRSADNLMCFTNEVIRDRFNRETQGPSDKAKVPQSITCATCPKADWTKYRQTKTKADIPPCEAFYYALFIDTVYKMPLQMYIRSKSKQPFEAGMQNLARTFAKLKSQGLNPNIFDIRFKMSTKLIKTGALPSYVIDLSDFKAINDEERQEFGEIYMQFANRRSRPDDEPAGALPPAQQVAQAQQAVNAQVVEPGTEGNVIEGEIQI